jgi:hypothetical protein
VAEVNENQSEQELEKSRQATLRALMYVRSQMTVLTDYIACIQQRIGHLERDLETHRPRPGRAA